MPRFFAKGWINVLLSRFPQKVPLTLPTFRGALTLFTCHKDLFYIDLSISNGFKADMQFNSKDYAAPLNLNS